MKKYDINNRLEEARCNACGQKIMHMKNIITGPALSFRAEWGYFSGKDGESHRFELCEKCYDMIVADFMIPVEITERTELL